jgi:putative transposase
MVYLAQARTAFALSNGIYGGPRLHRDLVDEGHENGRHRTVRLMRLNQLVALQKRHFKRTVDSEHAWPVTPNLVAQNFTAECPIQEAGSGHLLHLDDRGLAGSRYRLEPLLASRLRLSTPSS